MKTMALAAGIAALLQVPVSGQSVLPLWPAADSQSPAVTREHDTTTASDQLIAGKRIQRLGDVSVPTLAFYRAASPEAKHSAVVVFPGGGYTILAYDLEGVEVCQWLNTLGVSCAVLKYRVPGAGPYPKHNEDLADAQRAVRMLRQHAAEWNIDPKRIGVLGFSAGGHLAAVLGAHSSESVYPHADAADDLSAVPNFAVLVYPGGIVHPPDLSEIGAEVKPGAETPPTFLVQAEDDPVHVENSLLYYQTLKNAKIPAEMHIFAEGGHGYGLRETSLPVTHWPRLVEDWLRRLP